MSINLVLRITYIYDNINEGLHAKLVSKLHNNKIKNVDRITPYHTIWSQLIPTDKQNYVFPYFNTNICFRLQNKLNLSQYEDAKAKPNIVYTCYKPPVINFGSSATLASNSFAIPTWSFFFY